MQFLANPTFLTIQMLNAISTGMNLFIIASSLTLIFGVLRIVNFAHGGFYMIGAYVLMTVIRQMGEGDLSFWLGVLAAAVAMGTMAFFVERFLLARLYGREHLLQLFFTFALVLVIKDGVRMIWGSEQFSVSYPPSLSGAVNLGFITYPAYLLFLCVAGPVFALALWWVTERTRWGRILRASRLDREMLGALGTDVKALFSVVFVAGATLAAVGGALAAPRVSVDPGMDALVIIDCFIIVIVGGLGSLWGAFIGALGLSFISVFGTLFIGEWEIVGVYAMMIVVLLIRPWGLFGHPDEERY